MRKNINQGMLPFGEGYFGTWLAGKIIDSGYTAGEVANNLKITRQTITNQLHLRTRPIFIHVVAYCWFFNEGDNPKEIWELVEKDWA